MLGTDKVPNYPSSRKVFGYKKKSIYTFFYTSKRKMEKNRRIIPRVLNQIINKHKNTQRQSIQPNATTNDKAREENEIV